MTNVSQRVLITGATSGVGLEIARMFGRRRHRVRHRHQRADTRHRAAGDPWPPDGVCDDSKHADIEATIPQAVEALEVLEVLVNDAGIGGPTAPVQHVLTRAVQLEDRVSSR